MILDLLSLIFGTRTNYFSRAQASHTVCRIVIKTVSTIRYPPFSLSNLTSNTLIGTHTHFFVGPSLPFSIVSIVLEHITQDQHEYFITTRSFLSLHKPIELNGKTTSSIRPVAQFNCHKSTLFPPINYMKLSNTRRWLDGLLDWWVSVCLSGVFK